MLLSYQMWYACGIVLAIVGQAASQFRSAVLTTVGLVEESQRTGTEVVGNSID